MISLEQILGPELSKMNQKNYNLLAKQMKNKEVTFMLGAGVSMPAGLPNWYTLLSKMWARLTELDMVPDLEQSPQCDACSYQKARASMIETMEKDSYYEKANAAMNGNFGSLFDGMNVLEIAEYIRNYIKGISEPGFDSHGLEHITEQIVHSLIKESMKLEKDVEVKDLCGKMKQEAIGEISHMLSRCMSRTGKKGVHSVVTYNYDDLLECCLKMNEGIQNKNLNVVYDMTADKRPKTGKINIYHPHGYLPIFDTDATLSQSDCIILTETSYYQMEQKAYSWENSIQAKDFLDTTCVFIGFSGQDYNFRRMLKNRERRLPNTDGPHFIFFSLNDFVNKLFGEEVEKRFNEKKINELLDQIKGSVTGTIPLDILNTMNESLVRLTNHICTDADKKVKEKILNELAVDKNFHYEWVQLYHLLYAQHTYWESYGLTPIWTTYAELPNMIRKLLP